MHDEQHDGRQHGEGEHRPGQGDDRQHEQRRQQRPHHRAQARGPGQGGHGLGALLAAGPLGHIGLGRRVGGRAEAAEDRARQQEQHEDHHRRGHVAQARRDDDGAQAHRQAEPAQAQQDQRLASSDVGLSRPDRRGDRPQHRRQREDGRDHGVGNADLPADGGQHRQHARVPQGGRHGHAEENGEWASVVPGLLSLPCHQTTVRPTRDRAQSVAAIAALWSRREPWINH